MMRGWMMLCTALSLAACGGDRARDEGLGSATAAADSLAPAPPPAPTRADSAIAAAAGDTQQAPAVPVASGGEPGYSRWRELPFPSEPWEQTAASSEALLQRVRDVVAAQLEEPDAGVLPTRSEPEVAGRATGYLVHPDQADDSVQDVEFRIHMQREGAQWHVTGVDRRERCRRGVAPDRLCA